MCCWWSLRLQVRDLGFKFYATLYFVRYFVKTMFVVSHITLVHAQKNNSWLLKSPESHLESLIMAANELKLNALIPCSTASGFTANLAYCDEIAFYGFPSLVLFRASPISQRALCSHVSVLLCISLLSCK